MEAHYLILMFRFCVALLLILFSFGNLPASVYPSSGALFDVSSAGCAIGRPLNEVLDEVVEQTTFVNMPTDTVRIKTSSGIQKTYYYGDIQGKNLAWPAISASDTFLYVAQTVHGDMPNGGENDTVAVFGVGFTPGADMAARKVSSLWIFFWTLTQLDTSRCVPGVTYTWSESCSQSTDEIAEKSGSSFINDNYFQGVCPLPYKTYTSTGLNEKTVIKTADRKASVVNSKSISASDGVRQVVQVISDYYIGNLNYCPIVDEVYDTLCRGDLPGVYETSLTESGSDTLFSGKTWYGADSTFILHLVVNEPSESVVDSVCYSRAVTDTVYKTLYYTYTNAAGCDSLVTCNLTIIPQERDSSEFLSVIPDKFFTPNGDGINDEWHIQNIDLFTHYTVSIFDRFGKLLLKYKGNFTGWNGYYNGNPQPSTDYWYTISIDDNDTDLSGHFTLIR